MRARTVLIALGAVGVLGLGALALAASSPAPDPDPALDPREGEGDQPGAVAVIDPGHGGNGMVGGSSANNARGPGSTLEKDLTLDVSRRLRAYLVAHGLPAGQVLLTRDSDKNRGLSERLLFARQAGAAVFLSIHFNGFNGFNDPGVQGGEVWIAQNASPASVALPDPYDAREGLVEAADRTTDSLVMLRKAEGMDAMTAIDAVERLGEIIKLRQNQIPSSEDVGFLFRKFKGRPVMSSMGKCALTSLGRGKHGANWAVRPVTMKVQGDDA